MRSIYVGLQFTIWSVNGSMTWQTTTVEWLFCVQMLSSTTNIFSTRTRKFKMEFTWIFLYIFSVAFNRWVLWGFESFDWLQTATRPPRLKVSHVYILPSQNLFQWDLLGSFGLVYNLLICSVISDLGICSMSKVEIRSVTKVLKNVMGFWVEIKTI